MRPRGGQAPGFVGSSATSRSVGSVVGEAAEVEARNVGGVENLENGCAPCTSPSTDPSPAGPPGVAASEGPCAGRSAIASQSQPVRGWPACPSAGQKPCTASMAGPVWANSNLPDWWNINHLGAGEFGGVNDSWRGWCGWLVPIPRLGCPSLRARAGPAMTQSKRARDWPGPLAGVVVVGVWLALHRDLMHN